MGKQAKKSNPNKAAWLIVLAIMSLGLYTLLVAYLLRGREVALLNPKGFIADEQFKLLVTSTLIMLAFATIVLFFIYFFAWRYRESNQKVEHNPDSNSGRSKILIFTAWASPILIFAILTSLMIPATHKLEPQKPIESDKDEITIRVIAMQWKWLFMYPEQDIASVNFVQIPVDTPVRFELTADEAPMNSFWIPNLGGMLYSMTEHVNPLNLIAHTVGEYEGGAAEINGHGFAGMKFTAKVSSIEDFDTWATETASQQAVLDAAEYERLLVPSEYHPVATYASPTNEELFDKLVNKYTGSHNHNSVTEHTESEEY